MKTNTLIAIILGIAFIGACILGAYMTKDIEQLKSDLCYSLKTNRVLAEGWGTILNEEKPELMNKLYFEIESMENRNWMGCKE